MEYFVVKGLTINALIDNVNKLIQQGWKPQGGLIPCGEDVYTVYYQAMIKDTSKEK
jgi:hypothetical protein